MDVNRIINNIIRIASVYFLVKGYDAYSSIEKAVEVVVDSLPEGIIEELLKEEDNIGIIRSKISKLISDPELPLLLMRVYYEELYPYL
jgi:hypothetical protein